MSSPTDTEEVRQKWELWFRSRCESLRRTDYIFIRKFSPDWNDSVGLLCFARGVANMTDWPEHLPASKGELVLRMQVFKAMRIHCLALLRTEKRIVIGNWTGATTDGKNSKTLIRSLHHHHNTTLASVTAQSVLGIHFYILAALSVWLLSDLSTVIFGVGVAYKAAAMLLAHFKRFTALRAESHEKCKNDEVLLRRILSETMQLHEELGVLFEEMKKLEHSFAADISRLALQRNGHAALQENTLPVWQG